MVPTCIGRASENFAYGALYEFTDWLIGWLTDWLWLIVFLPDSSHYGTFLSRWLAAVLCSWSSLALYIVHTSNSKHFYSLPTARFPSDLHYTNSHTYHETNHRNTFCLSSTAGSSVQFIICWSICFSPYYCHHHFFFTRDSRNCYSAS